MSDSKKTLGEIDEYYHIIDADHAILDGEFDREELQLILDEMNRLETEKNA